MLEKQKKSPLSAFFESTSVAVFGASTNPQKSGYKIVENLMNHKYQGKIYPINPRGGEILGIPVFTSILEVEDPIDVAIVFVPNIHVVGVLTDCIKKGVKAAIIEAAGFGEVGTEGKKLRDQIIEVTQNFSKIRVLGPNCTGITFIESDGQGFFSSFIPMGATKTGNVAIVSQSGFINGAYYPDFTERNPNLGLRYVITIGNKMDLNENDILEYLIEEEKVSVIAMYVESFQNVRRFIKLCHWALDLGKDIVLLRSGLSSLGAKATTSHTGALAENSALIKAVIEQSGCLMAEDFWELFSLTRTLSFFKQTNIQSLSLPNAAIITISGAAGAVMTDWCYKTGITVPEFGDFEYSRLKDLYPPWMAPNRFALVDYWPAVEHMRSYEKVVLDATDIALSSSDIQAVFLTVYYDSVSWVVDWPKLRAIIEKHHKPVFVWMFGDYTEFKKGEKIFQEIRVPVFQSEKEIVLSFAKIMKARQFQQKRTKKS